jgi:hypothetical protein
MAAAYLISIELVKQLDGWYTKVTLRDQTGFDLSDFVRSAFKFPSSLIAVREKVTRIHFSPFSALYFSSLTLAVQQLNRRDEMSISWSMAAK